MIKLLKESYGDLSDYLERHLDSWYGRLNELGDAIEDLGLDVDEINNEYVIVHATEPDGEDVYCKIWLGGTSRTISLETFEMLESVRRSKNVLRESDDKITARSFQELISKLEDHGYSCGHYYDITRPDSNWLYIDKNGDPYEAEFYRYSDGEYELYLHNIHPTKRRNESVKRRKQVKENLYRVWYNPYGLDRDEEDFMEVTAETEKEARRLVSSSGYVTDVEEIEFKIDPYDECLDEANVVGMGGGYPNVYLPKAAKEYLKRRGFQEVDTEIGPCFYMKFTGNDVWEIYIDEQYGGIYVVQEGYELRPTDDIATIDDVDYKDDIDAVINLGNCLSNGEDFDSCLKAFFN